MDTFTKTVIEKRNYTIGFATKAGLGHAITLVSIVAINVATGVEDTSIIEPDSAVVVGQDVVFTGQNGVLNGVYQIHAIVTTSVDETLEGDVLLLITPNSDIPTTLTADKFTEIISTLRAGLASGAVRLQYQGRMVEYKSNRDIMQAITYFEGLQNKLNNPTATPAIRQIRMASSKGV